MRMPSWLAQFRVMAQGAGVICVRVHIAILSDGILAPQNKTAKILYDNIQYVAMHQIMTAPLFELARFRVGGG
jgi:hypothetical protein